MPGFRKKILFLLTRPPYPVSDGTKQKIMSNILDAVRGDFDCTLAIVSDVAPNPDAIAYLEKHYGKVNYYYRSRVRRAMQGLWYWLRGYPLQVGFFYSERTAREMKKSFEDTDVVYAHTLRFGKYLENLSTDAQKKVFLDFNDAISYNYKSAMHYASSWWRVIYALEAPRVARYEKKMLSYPFTFSIISEADKKYLADDRINVMRYGMPDGLLNVLNDNDSTLNAVFMGNMFYPPNLDAIKWLGGFLKRHSFADINGVVLDVVGRYPENLRGKFPDISFAGFMDDPYSFILWHKIFIAPLRFGAGVQTKVLEAMALGMPVMTTPAGARGIEGVENGRNIFIIELDNEAEWMNILRRLMDNPALRARIGDAAREVIRNFHTASEAEECFRELISKVLSSR